jgi:lipopolysaccharide/colanic/teichoic acid biosynthesis glycosyltransferase
VTPWPLAHRAAKRAVDVAAAAFGLAALSPLLVALGAAVRLTSPGPALFRQERVGRGGRRFRIVKLRTMVDGAQAMGPELTAAGDARVTPLGRQLRRAKLDELPQLWNVLVGEMSLVGPRPEVPRFVAENALAYRSLLAVRPGITDPASLAFRHEEELLAARADRERAYSDEILPQKLALSRAWLERPSLLGDLRLVVRTLAALAR